MSSDREGCYSGFSRYSGRWNLSGASYAGVEIWDFEGMKKTWHSSMHLSNYNLSCFCSTWRCPRPSSSSELTADEFWMWQIDHCLVHWNHVWADLIWINAAPSCSYAVMILKYGCRQFELGFFFIWLDVHNKAPRFPLSNITQKAHHLVRKWNSLIFPKSIRKVWYWIQMDLYSFL